MKEISLSKGKIAIVDDEDYEHISPGIQISGKTVDGYVLPPCR